MRPSPSRVDTVRQQSRRVRVRRLSPVAAGARRRAAPTGCRGTSASVEASGSTRSAVALEPIRKVQLYEQISARIIERIRLGAWPTGQRLPAERGARARLRRQQAVAARGARCAADARRRRDAPRLGHMGRQERARGPRPETRRPTRSTSASARSRCSRRAAPRADDRLARHVALHARPRDRAAARDDGRGPRLGEPGAPGDLERRGPALPPPDRGAHGQPRVHRRRRLHRAASCPSRCGGGSATTCSPCRAGSRHR